MGPNDIRSSTAGPNIETGASAAPIGIVLSRDLFFAEKVRGTAEALGLFMRTAGDPARARSLIASERPRVVVLDLTAGDLTSPSAVIDYQRTTGLETWYLAAGPHVQGEALAAARQAGCQVVLPFSRFTAELPVLLRDCFRRPAPNGPIEGPSK